MRKVASFVNAGDLRLPLRRSAKRQSIGIKVAAGTASVAAPKTASLQAIETFVQQKLPWIQKHLAKQQQIAAAQPTPDQLFAHGQAFNFLGRQVRLQVQDAPRASAEILGDHIEIGLPRHLHYPAAIRQAVKFAYSKAAYRYVGSKIPQYTAALGVAPKSVSIKEYKSRWGSCNSRGELQFNWLLMQAPESAVDYVIVHELCHLIHLNHSPQFWSLVKQFAPDYPQWRRWFKDHGATLHI